MNTREEMLNLIPKNSICCEVGVFEGSFSNIIINTVNPEKFYMVDLFQGNMVSGDKNGNNMKEISLDESYKNLKEKYYNNNKVTIFKGTSEQFYKSIPEGHLDFIYIDGDHSYEGVRLDLQYARSRVKKNGIISGHDYTFMFPGVVSAVKEFLKQYSLSVSFTNDGCPSYYIVNL